MNTKRFLSGLTAAVLVISAEGFSANVFAADAAPVKHLFQTLTASGNADKTDDFNGDGVITAVDLTLMKRSLLAEEQLSDAQAFEVPATAAYTKLIGRTLTEDGVTWLVQSGSAVECTVTAENASVTLTGDGNVYSDEKYRPRYAVYVDDELIKDVVMDKPEETVELFKGQKTAKVKIIHLSEANNGAVGVKSISGLSAAKTPVRPTAKKDLSIEFIGDSITCAYGVEADSQYVSYSTATENFTLSYAYLTAQLLNADYSAVSYSGHGIISGYTNETTANTDSLVPPVYSYVGKIEPYAVPWDFEAHPNDAVVINLGTNDDSYATQDLETRGAEYTEGYVDFLKQVREKNPDAAIICTLGIMGCEELYPYLEAAVESLDDPKISCYQSPTQNIAENGAGADWHPSAITHELNSYLLASKICAALGMEYNGVGLDMAAESTFSLETADGSGANAWPYFSEWNRSYNVNIMASGKTAEDMTVHVQNISLTPGVYELSFTVNPPEDASVSYDIRQNGTILAGSDGIMVGNGNNQTVTQKITVTENMPSCEIVFGIGAVAGGNMTFQNVTLYKKEA